MACKEELKNELKILKPSTIVLILKTDNCMVNFFQDMILKHFSTHPLKAYKNSNQKHGLNIIGDVNYILKTLDDQKDLVSSQYPRDNLPKGQFTQGIIYPNDNLPKGQFTNETIFPKDNFPRDNLSKG